MPPVDPRARTALWWAVWSAALWSALLSRSRRGGSPWLVDWNSVTCAARRLRAGLSLYGPDAACPGLPTSGYVYPPWIAHGWAAVVGAVGERAATAGYATVFLAALAGLGWAAFLRRPPSSAPRERAPFLALLSGNLVVVGNLAVPMQALIAGAALGVGAGSAATALAVAAAALVKPIYLTFLAVPAYAPGPAWRRAALVAVPAAAVLALALSPLPGLAAWRALVLAGSVDASPGGGVLRWLHDAGVRDRATLAGAYLVYAAALFLAGLAIAERGGLEATERAWLGLAVGGLLLPRLEAYDLLVLSPGLVAAAGAAARVSPRWGRAARALGLAACGLYLTASLAGGELKLGHEVALLALAAGVVALGVRLLPGPPRLDARPRPA